MIVPTFNGNRVITVIERNGKIGFPGGGNDKGNENSRQAAMREFREEAGVDYKDFTITSEEEIIHKHKNGSTTLGILVVCSNAPRVNPNHRFIEHKHGKEFVETLGVMLPRVSQVCDALRWNEGRFHCNFTNKHVNKPVCCLTNSIAWNFRDCISNHPHSQLVAFLEKHSN